MVRAAWLDYKINSALRVPQTHVERPDTVQTQTGEYILNSERSYILPWKLNKPQVKSQHIARCAFALDLIGGVFSVATVSFNKLQF